MISRALIALCLALVPALSSAQLTRVTGGTVACEINSGTTCNLTMPTVENGDIAILTKVWFENFTGVTSSAVTNFTDALASTVLGGSGNEEDRIHVLYNELDGSEDGATIACTVSGTAFAGCILDVYRGAGALTFASATAGTPATGTSATAPSVTVGSGQGLVVTYGTSDPTTMTTPTGMSVGTVGLQNTSTGRFFYETPSAGASGTRTSTLGTSRNNIGVSILLDGASAGGGGGTVVNPISGRGGSAAQPVSD